MAQAKALALIETSIGKKAIAALTGAAIYAFAFVHAVGNLQVFLGREHFNEYADFLQSMPKVVWGTRIGLLLALITHIVMVVQIAMGASKARTTRYKVDAAIAEQNFLQATARKMMLLSGLVIFAYITFHILHLTAGVVPSVFYVHGMAFENLVYGMRNPAIAGFYIFANLLLGLHLFHGAVAIFQTLGLKHPQWDARSKPLALLITAVITFTNVVIPIACMTYQVGAELPANPADLVLDSANAEANE
jgi:succinate dehydrogenase / fumarate reductase cytochrome b subunit